MKGRIILEGDVVHIYQLSFDKGIIFYERKDFLVFFTLFSCLAYAHHIVVAGLCIMLNHFHAGLMKVTIRSLADFMRELKSEFSVEYNRRYGRKGTLWGDSGWSVKRGNKQVRTFASYLHNNPVEKFSCATAEEYQWNFLKYAVESNPFSCKIPLRKASKRFRRAVDTVDHCVSRHQPLNYRILDALFEGLTTEEERSLTDYIICRYNCINHAIFLSYYGSYDAMTASFKASFGKEYDIDEYRSPASYGEFKILYKITVSMGYIGKDRTFFNMSEDEKAALYEKLLILTDVSRFSIQHYIHHML